MKKSIYSLLLLVAMSATSVFAGEPIPGVGVGAGKNPGGIMVSTKTDENGKFSFTLKEGTYTLKLSSYDDIIKMVRSIDKVNEVWDITLILEGKGIGVKTKEGGTLGLIIKIDRNTGILTVTVPKGGAVLSGTMTSDTVKK